MFFFLFLDVFDLCFASLAEKTIRMWDNKETLEAKVSDFYGKAVNITMCFLKNVIF